MLQVCLLLSPRRDSSQINHGIENLQLSSTCMLTINSKKRGWTTGKSRQITPAPKSANVHLHVVYSAKCERTPLGTLKRLPLNAPAVLTHCV